MGTLHLKANHHCVCFQRRVVCSNARLVLTQTPNVNFFFPPEEGDSANQLINMPRLNHCSFGKFCCFFFSREACYNRIIGGWERNEMHLILHALMHLTI